MRSAPPPPVAQPRREAPAWHALPPDEVAARLAANPVAGLDPTEATRRLAADGANEIPGRKPPSRVRLFLRQFESLIVWVLVGAAAIAFLLGDHGGTVAILAIVLLNAGVGFVQEHRAERALEALRSIAPPQARVVRGGATREIRARDLVRGDIVLVEAGDIVPADLRLLQSASLRTNEAALTGESAPVAKDARPTLDPETALHDRSNLLFSGTPVAAGRGSGLVVGTGMGTEIGRIAQLIAEARPTPTPLEGRIADLGRTLVYASLAVVAVVFVLGILRGEPAAEMVLTSVSLAVAAIPEGLPAVVTITLALGVQRMAARHALVRRLAAVETLGATTIICSDKTGTLTQAEMTVTRVFAGGETFEVTGTGFAPAGEFRWKGSPVHPRDHAGLVATIEAGVLASSASIRPRAGGGGYESVGDPTEAAIVAAAAKAGIPRHHLDALHPAVAEIPFDSDRKMMTIIRRRAGAPDHAAAAGGATAYVKGAPALVLARCATIQAVDGARPMAEVDRAALLDVNRRFAEAALRVLAVATRPLAEVPAAPAADAIERDLEFLGFVAMMDPPRPEALAALARCRTAGVRTVMITGDQPATAAAVAGALGISAPGADGAPPLAGSEIDRLSDDALARRLERTAVLARVTAEHKLRVVRAFRGRGAIVAMTGDGVNDAPAIKEASIGVAMGSGSQVTREAADIVITDDHFATIVAAVEEGRAIFENIRKFVSYIISINVGEIAVVLLASLFGLPAPLYPVQILWINLVTNGLPALALGVDPPDPDAMRGPPRPPAESIITGRLARSIIARGLFMGAVTLAGYWLWLPPGADLAAFGREHALLHAAPACTLAFNVLVFSQLFHAFNWRSQRRSVLELGILTNGRLLLAVLVSLLVQMAVNEIPATRSFLRLAPLTWSDRLIAAALGIAPFLGMEGWKALRRRFLGPPARP